MRILFCPHDSPGYALPCLGLAEAIRQRGHEVAFVPRSRAFAVALWHQPRAAVDQERRITHAIADFAPDLLVASALGLGALMAAERADLPVAVLGLMDPLPPGGPSQRQELERAHAAARAHAGLSPRPVERMRGDRYLRRSLPSLAPDLAQGSVLVGPCLWDPPPSPEVARWLDRAARPVIYAHQARTFGGRGFWPELCRLTGVQVAASTSRMDQAPTVSPHGGLTAPLVPQGQVLAEARAVVCSGTTTVALGALAHGVPLVLLPSGTEQFAISDRLGRAGCAVRLTVEGLTVDALQSAVDQALGEGPLRARATELATEAAGFPGFDVAADAVLGLA